MRAPPAALTGRIYRWSSKPPAFLRRTKRAWCIFKREWRPRHCHASLPASSVSPRGVDPCTCTNASTIIPCACVPFPSPAACLSPLRCSAIAQDGWKAHHAGSIHSTAEAKERALRLGGEQKGRSAFLRLRTVTLDVSANCSDGVSSSLSHLSFRAGAPAVKVPWELLLLGPLRARGSWTADALLVLLREGWGGLARPQTRPS